MCEELKMVLNGDHNRSFYCDGGPDEVYSELECREPKLGLDRPARLLWGRGSGLVGSSSGCNTRPTFKSLCEELNLILGGGPGKVEFSSGRNTWS